MNGPAPSPARAAAPGAARSAAAATVAGDGAQYLTFSLGEEVFAMDIANVREIIQYGPMTAVPLMPAFVRGVINLRGIIIPIFDLRARFGGGPTQVTPRHVVVVIQVGERTRGILVDAISDILAIDHSAIKPPPDMETGLVDAEYLSGLYTADNRMVTLLSVERLFAAETGDDEAVRG